MIILRRVYHGVTEHFPLRVAEWVMLWPAIGVWLALYFFPKMFSTSPEFATLASWADEGTWSVVIGLCGACRLGALTVNGTFRTFSFSPHFRAAASAIGAIIWFQYSLGFFMAFASSDGALPGALMGSIGWATMVVIEVFNTHRSWSDIGKHTQGHR